MIRTFIIDYDTDNINSLIVVADEMRKQAGLLEKMAVEHAEKNLEMMA